MAKHGDVTSTGRPSPDLVELDERVPDLARTSARRSQPGAGAASPPPPPPPPSPAADASSAGPAADQLGPALDELRGDIRGMRSAFLELPAMDELDGRLGAIEERLLLLEAAVVAVGDRLADITEALWSRRRVPLRAEGRPAEPLATDPGPAEPRHPESRAAQARPVETRGDGPRHLKT